MSGIAGIVEFNPAEADINKLKKMTDSIAHRGPDYEGHYIKDSIALGYRHLSVTDLSTGEHQPLISHDKRYTIVYDGRIYNSSDLRKSLNLEGVKLQTDSDAEVILEMYRKHGSDCVNHYNGMWAFVIFDSIEKHLFISRDRVGIKPIYYLVTKENFTIASEIKALLYIHPGQRIPNKKYIKRFITSGLLDYGEETFFDDIMSFPAAHNAIFDLKTNVLSFERYWKVDEKEFTGKWIEGKNPLETFEQLMESSIALSVRRDEKIGSCLSGGIDSSLIVTLAAERINSPLKTFSGLYPDKGFNEKKYVDAVNSHINTEPINVDAEPKGNLVEMLKQITWHQDEPSAGPGLITHTAVMRTASRYVKVVLDGQGADELFSGYLSFLLTYLLEIWRSKKFINKIRAIKLFVLISIFWGIGYIPNVYKKLRRYGLKIVKSKLMNKEIDGLNALSSELTDNFNKQAGDLEPLTSPAVMSSPLNNLCFNHLTKSKIPALLRYGDRSSMAFSIESRVPILDYRIVEYALALPPEYKIHGAAWTKWPLRKLASKLLPGKIAWRRSKYGYPTPFSRWLREGNNVEQLKTAINQFKKRDIVKPEIIELYYQHHMSGKEDNSWLLYRYITLELWYQIYIDAFLPHYIKTNGEIISM